MIFPLTDLYSLASALDAQQKLRRRCQRFKMIASCPHVTQSDEDVPKRISQLSDTLCKLESALQEVARAIQILKDLDPKSELPASLTEQEVSGTIKSSKSFRDRVVVVEQDVNLTTFPILLQGDRPLLRIS